MPCSDPAYYQFDFWLGEWEVRKPDGTASGQWTVAFDGMYKRRDTGTGAFRIDFITSVFPPP
jgi:hypothetical protein